MNLAFFVYFPPKSHMRHFLRNCHFNLDFFKVKVLRYHTLTLILKSIPPVISAIVYVFDPMLFVLLAFDNEDFHSNGYPSGPRSTASEIPSNESPQGLI
jgi:hypothetical protein